MGAPLMVAGFLLSAAQTVSTISSARAEQKAQVAAANRNLEQQYKQLQLQQDQIAAEAQQDKTERSRQVDREIASLRVISGETGGLGTVTSQRLIGQAGYFAGLDLARIEGNRKRASDAVQQNKEAARVGALNTITDVTYKSYQTQRDAAFRFVGSGLQIYGDYSNRNAAAEIAGGKK